MAVRRRFRRRLGGRKGKARRGVRRSVRRRPHLSLRKRKFKRARKFGYRVNRALKSVGTYNFVGLIDNNDTMPRIGTNGPLPAGGYGAWWNVSGGQNGSPTFEITQLIAYNGAPSFQNLQQTRQSTRVRIKRVEIYGSVKPRTTITNNSGNRYWLDLEPMCWMQRTRAPAGGVNSVVQSQVKPAEMYADRYGVATTTVGTAGPSIFYLQPPNLQHGKHAFRKFKSRQGLKRFNAQYQNTYLQNPNSAPPNPDFITGAMPASTGGDEIGYYHWTIPIDQICEYPRTSGQNGAYGDVPAMNPIFLDWHGRLSPSLQDFWDSNQQVDYEMARWNHFHIFVIYEDLVGLTV